MAEQLNHTDSETVYVDFSKASMLFAQARSMFRKTTAIVWVTDWIENIPKLGILAFDFAICTGD